MSREAQAAKLGNYYDPRTGGHGWERAASGKLSPARLSACCPLPPREGQRTSPASITKPWRSAHAVHTAGDPLMECGGRGLLCGALTHRHWGQTYREAKPLESLGQTYRELSVPILPVRTQIQMPFLGSTAEIPVSEPTFLSPNHAASPENTVLGQVMLWIWEFPRQAGALRIPASPSRLEQFQELFL